MRKFRIKVTHAYERHMDDKWAFGEEKTQYVCYVPLNGPCLHDTYYSLCDGTAGAFTLLDEWYKTIEYKGLKYQITKIEVEAV